MAPSNATRVKVRTPAASDGELGSLCFSRSRPMSRPTAKATVRLAALEYQKVSKGAS